MATQLRFKKEYYEAVPHLFEENCEVQIQVCKPEVSKPDWFLLSKQDDGKAVFFSLLLDKKDESQFHAFKEGIDGQGQQDPILCDEQGNVLDGYARWFALKALRVPDKKIKVVVVKGLGSLANKVTFVRQRKLARHHLTEKQRMALVQAEIKAHQERAHNWHAKLLGVSYNTVAKYRKIQEEQREIKILKSLRCSNGTTTPNKNPGKPLSKSGNSTKPGKSPIDEAKDYASMRDNGLTIPEIADKTKQNAEEVANRLKLLRLNQDKQKQVHEGKLDPTNALKGQKSLIRQVEEELPTMMLLPKNCDLEIAMSAINEFLHNLAGKDLNDYTPKVRKLITEMADFWSKKYEQLMDALEEAKPKPDYTKNYSVKKQDGTLTFHGNSPMVEAQEYLGMKHQGMSIIQIANRAGKSQQEVRNRLELLGLTAEKQLQVHTGTIDSKKALNALLKREQNIDNAKPMSDDAKVPSHDANLLPDDSQQGAA